MHTPAEVSTELTGITLTAGEVSENHYGMKQQGVLADVGYTMSDLETMRNRIVGDLGGNAEILRLHEALPDEFRSPAHEAGVLVVKDGVNMLLRRAAELGVCENVYTHEDMCKEQIGYQWDKKYFDVRRTKVLNKHARFNVCYGLASVDADFEAKRGTIIGYDRVPILAKWRLMLPVLFGPKATECEVEGNFYKNVKVNGIGPHGDAERRRVIAARFGVPFPLKYKWYYESKSVGEEISIDLAPGDMYVMSEKAAGTDWKRRKIPTLRHCAGGPKYTKFK